MTYDYDGSQVLFRQAKARSLAARRFTKEAAEERERGRSGIERKQRERDAVIVTVVLTQAAAEGYANWAHIQAGTSANGTWVNRWETLPAAAEAIGRPAGSPLSAERRDFLNLLGAWRNALLHADARARDRLHDLLTSTGALTSGTSEIDLLTADLAEAVVKRADELFRWAQDLTSIQAPFLDHAWIAGDELLS
ncbi:hypothetical protein R6V09_00345 [Streptomyces sp. W16]|uniref:hypothetical protein n=1 Tax=Streptomyces sp. W16 TaxID=3076631 RepID=UPI00295B1F1E|nr:hypothetical protein [Streptomyces sp. W16]MDV9168593.1 hypothetical protein [Streptomyces sp. W16]